MISYGDWKYETTVLETIADCVTRKRKMLQPAFVNLFQSVELPRESIINIIRRVSYQCDKNEHDEFIYSNIFREEIKSDVNCTALARKFIADIREAESDPVTAPVTAPRISLPMADLSPGKEFVDALVKADGDAHKAVDIVSKEPKLKRKISGGDKEENLIQAAEKQLDPDSKGDARRLARAVAREEKDKIKKKIMKRIPLPMASDTPPEKPAESPKAPSSETDELDDYLKDFGDEDLGDSDDLEKYDFDLEDEPEATPEPAPKPPEPAPAPAPTPAPSPEVKPAASSELTADDLQSLKYPSMNPKDVMYMINGLLNRGIPAWKIATENPRLTSRIISLLQRMGKYHDADTLRHYL